MAARATMYLLLCLTLASANAEAQGQAYFFKLHNGRIVRSYDLPLKVTSLHSTASAGSIVRSYDLPLKVTCTYQSGQVRKLVLTAVEGDSLHFVPVPGEQRYDCKVKDLERIGVRRKLNVVRDIVVVGGACATVAVAGGILATPYGLLFLPIAAMPAMVTWGFAAATKNTFRTDWYGVKN